MRATSSWTERAVWVVEIKSTRHVKSYRDFFPATHSPEAQPRATINLLTHPRSAPVEIPSGPRVPPPGAGASPLRLRLSAEGADLGASTILWGTPPHTPRRRGSAPRTPRGILGG
jgi:hypothetical protein